MTGVGTSGRVGAARVGGWSLIAAAVGFMAVFGYLAARFDYPAVLDGTAADVLPRLRALGSAGRAVSRPTSARPWSGGSTPRG